MTRYRPMIFGALFAFTLVLPVAGRSGEEQKKLPSEAYVQFAELTTPTPGPNTLSGAISHLLLPDDVTIAKGGTVTFIVNNGGHAIAIHKVSRETTRADIADDLCQGGANEADRAGRFEVCNANPGNNTQNLAYEIRDGEGTLVINVPQNVGNNNPRVDDATSSERLLATGGRSNPCAAGQAPPTCDPTSLATNPAGGFLTGAATPSTVGERIRVTFNQNGRYLVICMNRGHLLNDHMFGFVNVGNFGEDEQDEQ